MEKIRIRDKHPGSATLKKLVYGTTSQCLFFSLEANKNDSLGSKDQAIMRRYHRKKSYLLLDCLRVNSENVPRSKAAYCKKLYAKSDCDFYEIAASILKSFKKVKSASEKLVLKFSTAGFDMNTVLGSCFT
jgi:hypothetical protein